MVSMMIILQKDVFVGTVDRKGSKCYSETGKRVFESIRSSKWPSISPSLAVVGVISFTIPSTL